MIPREGSWSLGIHVLGHIDMQYASKVSLSAAECTLKAVVLKVVPMVEQAYIGVGLGGGSILFLTCLCLNGLHNLKKHPIVHPKVTWP